MITIAIVWFCAWAGDTASFFIGRRLGREFILKHGPKVRITPERFEQVEGYFDRHGGKTILIGRFIGLVRALAPFIAGSSGMQYRAFVPYSVLGTGLWAAAFSLLGYFAREEHRQGDRDRRARGALVFGLAGRGRSSAVDRRLRYLRKPENRARAGGADGARPVLRPARARAAAGRRRGSSGTGSRPAGSGSSSRRLLAVLAGRLFVLDRLRAIVTGDPGADPGRRRRRSTSSTTCAPTGSPTLAEGGHRARLAVG